MATGVGGNQARGRPRSQHPPCDPRRTASDPCALAPRHRAACRGLDCLQRHSSSSTADSLGATLAGSTSACRSALAPVRSLATCRQVRQSLRPANVAGAHRPRSPWPAAEPVACWAAASDRCTSGPAGARAAGEERGAERRSHDLAGVRLRSRRPEPYRAVLARRASRGPSGENANPSIGPSLGSETRQAAGPASKNARVSSPQPPGRTSWVPASWASRPAVGICARVRAPVRTS